MSGRRKLQYRIRQLTDIRGIMDAMRNLAVAEVLKLKPRLENQQRIVSNLERMAAVFLRHHPHTYPENGAGLNIQVVFGSERGFCGDFNEALINHMLPMQQDTADKHLRQVLVGSKLARRFAGQVEKIHILNGSEVTESVTGSLNNIVECIGRLHIGYRTFNVVALFHDVEQGAVVSKQILPPFLDLTHSPDRDATGPLLHITPAEFFSCLVDEYLYFALHEIAYASLLAENNKRVQHMTGALRRLDEKTAGLTRQYHLHRQEEITEELEVIMMYAGRDASGPGDFQQQDALPPAYDDPVRV